MNAEIMAYTQAQYDESFKRFTANRAARDAGIRRAYANGVTVSQLVKITGLSRARIYNLLDLSRDVDTASSASRQHYIDTGRYLPTYRNGKDEG